MKEKKRETQRQKWQKRRWVLIRQQLCDQRLCLLHCLLPWPPLFRRRFDHSRSAGSPGVLKAAVILLTPNLCKPSLGEEILLLKCPSSQCAFCFRLEQDRVEETGELGIQLGPQGFRGCSPHAIPGSRHRSGCLSHVPPAMVALWA